MDERGNGQQGVGCACGPRDSAGIVLDLDASTRPVVGAHADEDAGLAVLDQELARILTVLDGDLAELMDPEASIYDGADSHEERRARQLHAYRDADGQLRTRHGLLSLAR